MQWKLLIRGIAAMIIGYGAIVCLTSFGFNIVLGGRSFYGGSPFLLAAGMTVAIIAGLIGGYLAGLVGGSQSLIYASLVLLPLTVDTVYVLFLSRRTAPFWFDAMGSGILMLCTLLGGFLRKTGSIAALRRDAKS
jgi:hypothetical protein